MAACSPLAFNPVAFGACTLGCGGLSVSEEDSHKSARFMPNGTVVFEKESPQCAEACKLLVNEPLTYSACLVGCAAAAGAQQK
jgi:hypothetical protein